MADKIIRPDPIPVDLEAEHTPHDFIYTPPPAEVEETTYTPNPQILQDTSQTSLIEPGVSERMITTAKVGDVVPYVFGHTLVKPLTYVVVDKGNGGIAVDYIISTGICEEVDKIVQDGETFDITGNSFVNWEFYMGEASQVASPKIGAALGSPNAYDTLDGICHVVADVNQWTSFDVRFIMKGIICRDPRTSPQLGSTYTDNPALIIARVYEDSGYTVNDTALSDAATWCEAVTGSPELARWTINLPIYNRKSLDKWVHTLAVHASLLIDIRGGEVYLIPDKKVTSSPQITHTITVSDIQRPRTVHKGVGKVPEKVIVDYRETDGTTGSATAGSGSSGRVTRLRMPGYNSYTMSKRKAEEVLAKAQADLVHEHTAFDVALEPTVGDLADITYAPHNLSSQRMRLIDHSQTSIGRWHRSYAEYSDSLYDDSTYTPPDPGTNPGTDPPGTVPTGPTPVMSTDCFQGRYGRIKVTFTESTWPHVQQYMVRVFPSSGSPGQDVVLSVLAPHTGDGTQVHFTAQVDIGDSSTSPITPAVEYTAWVNIVSNTNNFGLAGSATFTPSGFDQLICTLTPDLWFKFDDASFATTINDYGSAGADLTSQNTTDASAGTAMRTTRSQSLEMPAFTDPNWSSQAAHYTEDGDIINDLTTGTYYTWVFSLKMADLGTDRAILWNMGPVHTIPNSSAYATYCGANAAGELAHGIRGSTGNSLANTGAPSPIVVVDDDTSHIIVIRNSLSANALDLWVDGVLIHSGGDRLSIDKSGTQFNIGGKWGTDDTSRWNSDCLAFWDEALTDQQVTDLQAAYLAEL